MSDFWDQLQVFSDRFVRKRLGMSASLTPWRGGARRETRGAVIHYTADVHHIRVVKWFLEEKFRANVSANAVVLEGPLWDHDDLADGLPLIAQLPASVIQCAPPAVKTWHATWANDSCYGIENINIGELRKSGDTFFSWRPRDKSEDPWTTIWPSASATPVPACGRFWIPYPTAQLATNVILLRELRRDFPIVPSMILGHDAVQGTLTRHTGRHDKRDPGPLYPMSLVRDLAFSDGTIKFHDRNIEEERRNGASAWLLLGYSESPASIKPFQRMMGLTPDGIAGPNTTAALQQRLVDRGIVG